MNTNRWMQEVNARFPVRKSKVQKAQFRQYVLQKAQEMGYAARVEENKAICTNRNIVVGDVDKAKVLVTAHYDTPATVGLPNVMLPMNRPMFYLVQALIALVMLVFIFVPTGIVEKLTDSIFCTRATLIGLYCLMMYLLLAGVPNPHNVNDNTSGVCGVLALMEAFAAEKPEEKRREGNRRRRTRSGKPGASAIKPFTSQPDAKPVSRQESQRLIEDEGPSNKRPRHRGGRRRGGQGGGTPKTEA